METQIVRDGTTTDGKNYYFEFLTRSRRVVIQVQLGDAYAWGGAQKLSDTRFLGGQAYRSLSELQARYKSPEVLACFAYVREKLPTLGK